MGDQRLFGTDGIRGVAGSFPLDAETLERAGVAVASVLAADAHRPRVLVGRDTRESGPAIEESLTRGLVSGGVRPTSAGVLSTPAVALLTRLGGFDAGIVISASHNPYRDNGIKVFTREGLKLPEELERKIESLVLECDPAPAPPRPPRVHIWRRGSDPLLRTRYLAFLASTLPKGFSFEGRRVVLDCANGAASDVAPEIWRRLGAEVVALGCAPDGRNINAGCGALHPERLAAEVRARDAFLGAAFDGDADRCILVDETGAVRDGDDVLAVAATWLHARGELGPAEVVGTVMANFGLEAYLSSLGIALVRTPVGDRHVVEEMLRRRARLGGEQSGHVIFLGDAPTGDGVLTSLRIAHVVASSGRALSALAGCWTRMPQVLRNVSVSERTELSRVPGLAERLAEVEASLSGRGRLLVRYSGTEPILRIMLEGDDADEIHARAEELAEAASQALNP